MENNNNVNKQVLGFNVSRNELTGMKKFFAEKLTQGLDYATTDEFEKGLEKNVKKMKKTVKVLGTVATVALLFCPADGPFGEIASIVATSGFAIAVDKLGDNLKDAYKAGKRIYVGSIKQNGEMQVSSIADDNTVENAKEFGNGLKNIKDSINDISDVISNGRKK